MVKHSIINNRRREVFTQQFTLPFPVSVNQLYTNIPGRGRVKSKRYREWLAAAGAELLAQKVGRISGNYVMALYVQRKKDRKRDIGNMEKGVSDFLRAMDIIDDDSLCDSMTLVWDNTVTGCCVVLTKA